MTLKYESEVLFDLMKRDGEVAPSDVLPYESALKEKYLNQVVGAYPKLQDYQPEWLYYNLYGRIPSEFPDESVANVTSASFYHVIPYTYTTAILKGLTLVNVIGEKSNDNPMDGYSYHDFLIPLVKKNTDYLIKYDTTLSGGLLATGFLHNSSSWSNNLEEQPSIGLIKLNSGEYPNYFRIVAGRGETVSINNLLIIEYQDGMEKWDIPYFEGMQSVQIPVLKTTGKNLFDGKWIKGKMITEDGGIISDNSSQYNEAFIRVSKGKYISSNNGTNRNVNIFKYDFDGNFIGRLGAVGSTFTVDGDCLIRLSLGLNNTDYFQFEHGTVATIYEPYKSNILTVNEDVTLRSNGSVYDELDLLTGKLTQRIDEDGSVLTQEVVKTVDLSCINEQGESATFKPIEGTMHVNTSSQTLPPLLDMSVPVEATTQNLMSFANIEEEE